MNQRPTVTAEDIAKLPWKFRRHIQELENQIRDFRRVMDAQGQTRVMLDKHDACRYLPNDTKVTFVLGDGAEVEVQLREAFATGRGEGSDLNIRSVGGMIAVLPDVSNSVYIRSRR